MCTSSALCVRDESFITSWGWGAGRLYLGGSEIFFGDIPGGVENKMTYGRGGGHVFRQVLGGGGQMCSIGLSFH